MRASDIYKGLLKELDKFESASFSISDFNYFINSVIDEYVTDNYAKLDVIQKDLDDIQVLIKNQAFTQSGTTLVLPGDYRHILGVEVVVQFIKNDRENKTGNTIILYPSRFRTNKKGYDNNNAYHQPSYKRPFYQIKGSRLELLLGDKVTPTSIDLEYIKKPAKVYLNPQISTANMESEADNTTLEFPDYVCMEIIKHCKRVFLENIESGRYQSTLQEQKLRNE